MATRGCESPRESWLKYLLFAYGFPAPTVQLTVLDSCFYQIGRGDTVYEDYSIVLEYDGGKKYDGTYGPLAEVLQKERHRERALHNEGMDILRFDKESIARETWVDELKRMMKRGKPFPHEQLLGGYKPVFPPVTPELLSTPDRNL